MKKSLLFLGLALMAPFLADGQVDQILIGVNGLTCSQCTRNVELKLRKLPFIADVDMNLEHTSGVIKLRPEVRVIPEAIARAVSDVGFSLRYLEAVVRHPERYDLSATCFTISGLNFRSAATMTVGNSETVKLRLLGAPYQPRKEIRQLLTKACGANVYFVVKSDD